MFLLGPLQVGVQSVQSSSEASSNPFSELSLRGSLPLPDGKAPQDPAAGNDVPAHGSRLQATALEEEPVTFRTSPLSGDSIPLREGGPPRGTEPKEATAGELAALESKLEAARAALKAEAGARRDEVEALKLQLCVAEKDLEASAQLLRCPSDSTATKHGFPKCCA